MELAASTAAVARGVALVVAVMAIGSCGSGIPQETATGPLGKDQLSIEALPVTCGAVTLSGRSLDLSGLLEIEDVSSYVDEEAAVEFDLTSATFAEMTFYEVERSEDRLVVIGESPASAAGEQPYFDATFERIGGEWRASGWGGCWPTTGGPEGYGLAQIKLDGGDEPSESSTSISLLVTEQSCASGQRPEGREVRPLVDESDDAVRIVVLIESPAGAQVCPSNPSFSVEVAIDEPLGDRAIFDAGPVPAKELVWPVPLRPSELSIVVTGEAPASGQANAFNWPGGGLMIMAESWSPGWVQGGAGAEPTVISGFIADCGDEGCSEECEGEGCDVVERVGETCAFEHPGDVVNDTEITIDYGDGTCQIEVASTPVAERAPTAGEGEGETG